MTKDTITSDLDLRTGVKPYALLTLCMLGIFFYDILTSADFLSIFFFKNFCDYYHSACLVIFHDFLSTDDILSKLIFFKNFFPEYHQSVRQLRYRSNTTFCCA